MPLSQPVTNLEINQNTIIMPHVDNVSLHGSAISGYAVNTDVRLTDAREPTAHNSSFHSVVYPTNVVFATHIDNTTLHGAGISGYAVNTDVRFTDARTPVNHDNTYHSTGFLANTAPYAVNTDARFTDAREPTAHNSSFHSVIYPTNTLFYQHLDNATPHTVLTGYAVNTDARFTDAREPTAHNSSVHSVGYLANTAPYAVNTDQRLIKLIQIKLSDEATAVTAGNSKVIWCVPPQLNGLNLVNAHAFVTTASTNVAPTYAIRNQTGSNVYMTSTNITIDANEVSSYTAATPPVINTSVDDVSTGRLIAIDKTVAGTGEKGDGIILGFV